MDDERQGGTTGPDLDREGPTWRALVPDALYWTGIGAFWLAIIAWSIRDRATSETRLVNAAEGPWILVALLLTGSIAQILVVGQHLRRAASSRGPVRFTRVLPTLILGIQGAGVVLLVLGQALVELASRGHAVVLTPSQSTATEGKLFAALLWHAAETIPLVELPGSLGWENPVPDPAWPLGAAQVVIRILFAGVLVSAVLEVWRTRRPRRPGSGRPTGPIPRPPAV